jgi:ComF family protein
MQKFCHRLRDFVLDLLFPIECLNCQSEGDYLCEECFNELKLNDTEYQKRAQINLKIPNLKQIYIAGDYENSILSNLIIKYKYNFLSVLGKTLARFLIIFWQQQIFENNLFNSHGALSNFQNSQLLAIPIPLSKKRLHWRGFNQAEIVAREFCLYFNHELNLDLKRLKHRAPQATLSETKRLENMESVFAWRGESLTNKRIILIDDVVTTGATLNEAARILKEAGAQEIYALVLAKG